MHMKIEVIWHVLSEYTATILTAFTKVHGVTSQKMYIGPLFWTIIGVTSCRLVCSVNLAYSVTAHWLV